LAEVTALCYTKAVVREKIAETPDTVTLTFDLADGRGPNDFQPGQFNMLYVPGLGEAPISVASSKRERYLKHTLRSVGSVTRTLVRLEPGDSVGLRGPFGTHWPLEVCRGKELLVIGGGCGLPSLRPVVLDAIGAGAGPRGIKVLYGARTPKDLLYTYEYAAWGKEPLCKVFVTVDRAEDDWPRTLELDGQPACATGVGVVTTLLDQVGEIPGDALAFVCGPEIMMKFAVLELLKRGVAPDGIVVSLERHMNCGRGTCGHCQLGPMFVCRDGPVLPYPSVKRFFAKEGL